MDLFDLSVLFFVSFVANYVSMCYNSKCKLSTDLQKVNIILITTNDSAIISLKLNRLKEKTPTPKIWQSERVDVQTKFLS